MNEQQLGEWFDEIEDYCDSNGIPLEQHEEWGLYVTAREAMS